MEEHIGQPGEELESGTSIAGRYEIVRLLGTGGMGSVYLVRDHVIASEPLALKLLHPEFARDPKQTQRFLREVQLMRRVNHPNVVRTFDVGIDQQMVYFTMEFIAGKSFDKLLDAGVFPQEQLGEVIVQICEGLEAIHEAGIIHRDLKPGNLILCQDMVVKITDFGVARPEQSDLTAHNEIVGSASYMAPEMWLGQPLTGRVDLYALGNILYEIATGELPFSAGSAAELMRLHLDRRPLNPRELNSGCPAWLDRLVVRLLEKNPQDRYQTANEVIRYVERYQKGASLRTQETDKPSMVSPSFIASLEQISQDTLDGKPCIIKPPKEPSEHQKTSKPVIKQSYSAIALSLSELPQLLLVTVVYSAAIWSIAKVFLSIEGASPWTGMVTILLGTQIPLIGLSLLNRSPQESLLKGLAYSLVTGASIITYYFLVVGCPLSMTSFKVALHAAGQWMLQAAFLSPFAMVYEPTVVGSTLFMKEVGITAFWGHPLYAILLFLQLGAILLYSGKKARVVVIGLLIILLLSLEGWLLSPGSPEFSFTLLTFTVSQSPWLWLAGLFNWMTVYLLATYQRG